MACGCEMAKGSGSRQRARQAYAEADTWARVPGTRPGEWDEEGMRRARNWLPVGLPALSTVLKQLKADEEKRASGEAVGARRG